MLISKIYEDKKEVKTEKHKFPLTVEVVYTSNNRKFYINFTDNTGVVNTLGQLWNYRIFDKRNKKKIEERIKIIEESIQRELQRSIEEDLMENRRMEYRKAKIGRFVRKHM